MFVGNFQITAKGVQRIGIKTVFAVVPRRHSALGDGKVRIGHYQIGVHIEFGTEAVAMGAGAVRVVERKQARFDFFNGETGDRTGKFGGKSRPLMRGVVFGKDKAVTEFERGLQRLGQPFADFRFNDKTVNHDFYVVFLVFIERRDFFDVINFAVDFQALIPLFLQAFDFFFVFAFLPRAMGASSRSLVPSGMARILSTI